MYGEVLVSIFKLVETQAHMHASLQPLQEDLHSSLSANTALATGHGELQAKFIETKTVALRVLERKLDLETSLRDHKQVRCQGGEPQ